MKTAVTTTQFSGNTIELTTHHSPTAVILPEVQTIPHVNIRFAKT